MVIISKTTIKEFAKKYPNAKEPLSRWYEIVKKADWSSFAEMRQDINSVDVVGRDRNVFNIKGNDYRLIALILFSTRTVFILWIGSHKAYDKINKTIGANNVEFKK